MAPITNNIPEKTIERLSEYRRTLVKCHAQDMREDVCDTLGVTLHERAAVLAQALDGLLRYRRGYIVICHVKVCFRSTRQLSSSRGGSADAPSWY